MMESALSEYSRRRFVSPMAATLCFSEHPGQAMTESVHRRSAVLDAPSNLGLKLPSPGQEPGVKNMPEVLRAHSIVNLLAGVFSRKRREA
jgi:hypothetical protein